MHGTSDTEGFEQIGFSLDVYSGHDIFLVAGDFNVHVREPPIDEFIDDFGARNLVNELTCFKSTNNTRKKAGTFFNIPTKQLK